MNTFFTSDTHFGHRNIIKYCARPFEGNVEMDQEMIRRWNEVVTPADTVYHLGDVGVCCSKKYLAGIIGQLNGHKILVRGNHDKGYTDTYLRNAGFAVVIKGYHYILNGVALPDKQVRLQHTPAFATPEEALDTQFLCGHVHEKWKVRNGTINVGVDQWDFRPHTMEQLMAALPAKKEETDDDK